mgnify:CR=1 FL=1
MYQVIRFLISGGIAAGVQLGTLYVVTHVLGLWYMYASLIAFVLAFATSFTLQKFWTFEEKDTRLLHSQALSCFVFALVGIAVNSTLLYVFVEYFGMQYLSGQIVVSALLAVLNFQFYRIVFKISEAHQL